MSELTFSSFLVNDGNRRAHELCLAISRGDPVSPLPITLAGERGSGKTHLLRAVAQRLRASVGHAAIVLVTQQTRTEEIDRIVKDPRPIDMARYAVLLVDDLHALQCDLERLARIVQIFLENDHPVVFASESHPDRLTKLPLALLRTVRSGQTVFVDGGEAKSALEVIEASIREEQREAVAKLEQKIREMEDAGPEALADDARRRVETADQLQRDLTEAREEIEHLKGENALLGASAKEAAELRKKLDAIERERVAHASRPAADPDEQTVELKRKLDEARFDAQKAREEARGMLERAQGLVEALHKSREDYESARRERDRHREEILKFRSLAGEDIEESGDAASPEDAPAEPESVETVAELAAPNPELDGLREEVHRLQESLVRARAERDNSKSHLAHVREDLDAAVADLERAREEAAAEKDGYASRIAELEAALVARQDEIDRLQTLQDAFTEEVRLLQSQVTEGADVLERLMELFGSDRPDGTEPRDPEGLPEGDISQAHADRPDFGEGIRLVPRRGPTLHHIEQIRQRAASAFPSGLPPLDDDEEERPEHMRSA